MGNSSKPYGEREFIKALVPVLIGRLPDPFSPTEADMRKVAEAAGKWAELLVDLRAGRRWASFLLDYDGPAWHESPYSDDGD